MDVEQTKPVDLDALKAIFDAHRFEWIAAGHEGEWTVFGEHGAPTFHRDYGDAVAAAVRTFGTSLCLIQQVLREDRVESFRHVAW